MPDRTFNSVFIFFVTFYIFSNKVFHLNSHTSNLSNLSSPCHAPFSRFANKFLSIFLNSHRFVCVQNRKLNRFSGARLNLFAACSQSRKAAPFPTPPLPSLLIKKCILSPHIEREEEREISADCTKSRAANQRI